MEPDGQTDPVRVRSIHDNRMLAERAFYCFRKIFRCIEAVRTRMRSGCFFIGSKLRFDPIKKLREDRTAAKRNNVAYATRRRRRILLVQRFVNNYTNCVGCGFECAGIKTQA